MKSNSIFFTTLTLAAPLAFLLPASALAQTNAGALPAAGLIDISYPAPGVIDVYWQGAPAQAEGTTTSPQPVQDTAATASTPRANVDFFFPGGTPSEFVAAVEKQYKVDWKRVVDIPNNMASARIPALRMDRQSVESMFPVARGFGGGGRGGGGGGGGGFGGGGGGGTVGGTPEDHSLRAVIALYNDVGQARPETGELRVQGDLAKPSVVIFRSYAANMTPDLKLKAFALTGIPTDQWDKLAQGINDQIGMLHAMNHEGEVLYKVDVHRDSKLLVVFGTPSDLEAVESLVTAWRANTSTGTTGPKL